MIAVYVLFTVFYFTSRFVAATDSNQVDADDIDELRQELREEFDESGRLRPLMTATVRLIFHDCVGPQEVGGYKPRRCNGCINFANPANAGLPENAVYDLDALYYASWKYKMSRSDFYAAAATIALEYAQELDRSSNDVLPPIPYYFGRTDCGPSSNTDAEEDIIHPFSDWKTIRDFFYDAIRLSERETVTIIGAHTLGQLHVDASGFSSLPWVEISEGPDVLNNAFYENVLNEQWFHSQSPTELWEWKDHTDSILMLDSDMTLVIDIEGYLDEDTGFVSCADDDCPVSEVIDITKEYVDSNQLWLDEFAAVFGTKLVVNGYDVDEELTVVIANSLDSDSSNGGNGESNGFGDSNGFGFGNGESAVSADTFFE